MDKPSRVPVACVGTCVCSVTSVVSDCFPALRVKPYLGFQLVLPQPVALRGLYSEPQRMHFSFVVWNVAPTPFWMHLSPVLSCFKVKSPACLQVSLASERDFQLDRCEHRPCWSASLCPNGAELPACEVWRAALVGDSPGAPLCPPSSWSPDSPTAPLAISSEELDSLSRVLLSASLCGADGHSCRAPFCTLP